MRNIWSILLATMAMVEAHSQVEFLPVGDNHPDDSKVITNDGNVVDNPFYRGNYYDNSDALDSLEVYQQRRGWEFLYNSSRKKVTQRYPYQISYYQYAEHQEYRVLYSSSLVVGSRLTGVYDVNGSLVYVPSLTRGDREVFVEVERLVYQRDYKNNKYDVATRSNAKTKKFLNMVLNRPHGFKKSTKEAFDVALTNVGDAIGSLFGKEPSKTPDSKSFSDYWNDEGRNYIAQLEIDHKTELEYVYIIQRLTDMSFQIVYVNSETKVPSICARVTYKTGEEPFTSDYSVKLVPVPSNVPLCVKVIDNAPDFIGELRERQYNKSIDDVFNFQGSSYE